MKTELDTLYNDMTGKVSTRYWKILENTGNTSIADTGKYWLYQYCRYWKIR
jgi:hypothetical protein